MRAVSKINEIVVNFLGIGCDIQWMYFLLNFNTTAHHRHIRLRERKNEAADLYMCTISHSNIQHSVYGYVSNQFYMHT